MDDIIRSFADITSVPDFKETADRSCLHTADSLDVLQMNIGRRCNLACKHCHVLSSPARTEEMSKEVMEAALTYAKEQEYIYNRYNRRCSGDEPQSSLSCRRGCKIR